jgi:hypothetical protein
MEYIVLNNKIFLIGKSPEIKEFLKEKTTTYKTVKDLILSESHLLKTT